jgi:predicted  nucleic acid-binding Zn-ribbon protein
MTMKLRTLRCAVMVICIAALAGCSAAYYGAMEKVGIHKRDLMVSRVEDARDAQEDAKEQFQSALEQFTSVVAVRGGDLEQKYNTLNDAYQESEKKADIVSTRIVKVEDVSEALFAEWEDELDLYANPRLREDSRKKLEQTRRDYNRLIKAMKRSEKKIQPVLVAFRDQVLYLKHNLNAQAFSSLKNELVAIEDNVAGLVSEMEVSIREAQQFIDALRKDG